jgi:predicted transcriptional regulator
MIDSDHRDIETGLDAWYGNRHHEFSTHLSTAEAGKLMGLSHRAVCLYIKSGRLRAIRMGRDWFVDFRDAKLFEKRPAGRPTQGERAARQRRDQEFNSVPSSDLLVAQGILVMDGVPLLSTAEVANVLGVSSSRVRQLVMGRRLRPQRHGSRVEYERQEIYIRATLTHADYDKDEWKRDTWFQR